ncbi:MAG: hypothetical protein ACNI26_08330 [Terasakiella sp.]|uniref:hypothetical protein n=1 Tax=unclassified Terasakiella TaxID=2614952 RepID=UPI003B00F5C1
MVLPDKREVCASVTVKPVVGGKAFTYRSYDVYLALEEIWYARDMPDEPMQISLREIMRYMEVPIKGKWCNILIEEMQRLFETTLSWSLSYKADQPHQTVKNQHILETFDYASLDERASLGNRFEKTCFVRFDQYIRDNLKKRRTIPVNWKARKAITSSVAKVLYSRLDNILA